MLSLSLRGDNLCVLKPFNWTVTRTMMSWPNRTKAHTFWPTPYGTCILFPIEEQIPESKWESTGLRSGDRLPTQWQTNPPSPPGDMFEVTAWQISWWSEFSYLNFEDRTIYFQIHLHYVCFHFFYNRIKPSFHFLLFSSFHFRTHKNWNFWHYFFSVIIVN